MLAFACFENAAAIHGNVTHFRLTPGSTLIEVIVRGERFFNNAYHKADFANLSRFFGARYMYYDAKEAVVPSLLLEQRLELEINLERAIVETSYFTDVVQCALEESTN